MDLQVRFTDNRWVQYDVHWSDHFPLVIECDLGKVCIKYEVNTPQCRSVVWGERTREQINSYHALCNAKLRQLDFPSEMRSCADGMCCDAEHRAILDTMYSHIVHILSEASETTHKKKCARKGGFIAGWNKHVAPAHRNARLKFLLWVYAGKPSYGAVHNDMTESRKHFKAKLKWCQDRQEQIKIYIIASNHANKDFKSFWKNTKKVNVKPRVPVSVVGVTDSVSIANTFKELFKVSSPLGPSKDEVFDAEDIRKTALSVRFSAKQVRKIIISMQRGKSPGHDGLSIEHLNPLTVRVIYT